MTGRPDSPLDIAADRAMLAYTRAAELTSLPDATTWAPATASPPGFTSSPPWNAAAANVLTGLHEFARRAEAELRAQAGLPARRRGGSDANTGKALDAICDLALAAPDCGWVTDALEWWATQADRLPAVGEQARWEPLPRPPGEPPMSCPWCGLPSLRCAPSRYLVMCTTPRCQDTNGRRPVARADVSRVDGTPVLAWSAGLVTGPR